MTAVALFVEFDIDPDQLAAFDALIADHAAKTLAGEAGCMDFRQRQSDGRGRRRQESPPTKL